MPDPVRVILASGSKARKTMLLSAGVVFDVVQADVDEDAIRTDMATNGGSAEPVEVAAALASEKAMAVSAAHPDALVIGADQILALGRRIFSKAATAKEARHTLHDLRGHTHELVSAVALAHGGNVVWQAFDSAQLTMRIFTDTFLEDYVRRAGDSVIHAVGCYELEGLGIQLFERIEGDYFTILGMPLLPLLAELRRRGVVLA